MGVRLIRSVRPTIRFTSDDIPAGDRFGRYRELYGQGADAVELGPDFSASMNGVRLDRAAIYDRRLVDVGHERTLQRCRHDEMEHFTLTCVLSGEFHADSGSGFVRVAPGETVLMDMTKPMRNRATRAHIVTMSIARDRVVALAGRQADHLHGHRIQVGSGLLLTDHLQSLVRHAASLPEEMLIPLSRISSDFLAIALNTEIDGNQLFQQQGQRLRLDQILTFIEQNLSDASFSPANVMSRFNISRATLYRVLHAHGGFNRYVRRKRLSLLRRRLSETAGVSLERLAHDSGFGTAAQASEAFLQEYEIRPGRYRRQVQVENELDRVRRRMGEWTADLS